MNGTSGVEEMEETKDPTKEHLVETSNSRGQSRVKTLIRSTKKMMNLTTVQDGRRETVISLYEGVKTKT